MSLFALHHVATSVRFLLTSPRSILFAPLSNVRNKLESSANRRNLNYEEEFGKSLLYNKINVGPKTDPWGTPHIISFSVDFIPS